MKMADSKHTVIVTDIGKDINTEEFVNHFKNIGNIIKSNMRTERSEGIVTYADPKTAEEAAKTLNGSNLKGSVIKVQMADMFNNHHPDRRDSVKDAEENTALQLSLRENENGTSVEQGCGGGKGGKGGRGGPNVPSGHDGEDGEDGPGGKGGAGGRPAVARHGEHGGGGGGKGGKGGQGGPNVPSGHDGEDGEPGPFGKGGAGGKPAVDRHGRNGEKFDKNNEHGGGGGGKGGKGGRGGPNVPSGHDGEDGEPGPFGKGGAGGKPAVTNANLGKRAYNPYDGNNDAWYTRWFGIGKGKTEKRPSVDSEHINTGGGKGGQGGQGSYGVKSGHAGEDGESGPFGKGGRGGRPAL